MLAGALGAAEPPANQPVAVAVRAATAPRIDGNLDEEIWRIAERQPGGSLTNWMTMAEPHRPIRNARTVHVAYDDRNLYVALRVQVDDTDRLDSRNDRPELSDCLRLDFQNSATGVDCEGNNSKLIYPYILPVRQAARIGSGQWTAEMEIPWKDVPGKPESTNGMPFNVSGHDYLDGFVSWAAVKNERDTEHFGVLRLAR
jgi:hypothetical protein